MMDKIYLPNLTAVVFVQYVPVAITSTIERMVAPRITTIEMIQTPNNNRRQKNRDRQSLFNENGTFLDNVKSLVVDIGSLETFWDNPVSNFDWVDHLTVDFKDSWRTEGRNSLLVLEPMHKCIRFPRLRNIYFDIAENQVADQKLWVEMEEVGLKLIKSRAEMGFSLDEVCIRAPSWTRKLL
jgi:hypothetical protein